MRITSIVVDGVKGVRRTIALNTRCLLLIGGMGSGKSAVLEGIALALGVPTEHGSIGLDRLSPTGVWRVKLQFEDAAHHELERMQNAGKASFRVDGVNVPAANYWEAVKVILDVDDHHVWFPGFRALSGQARAQMFASMLASSEAPISVGDLLDVSEADPAVVAKVRSSLVGVAGTPGTLYERIKTMASDATRAASDSRIRHSGLVDRASASTGNPSMIQREIGLIDEEIGKHRGSIEDAEKQREAFESGKRVLTQADAALVRLTGELETARNNIAIVATYNTQIGERAGKIDKLEQEMQALVERGSAMDAERVKAVEDYNAIVAGRDTLRGLLKRKWQVDTVWLVAEIEAMAEKIPGMGDVVAAHIGASTKGLEAIVALAKEIATEVCGGDEKKVADRIAAAERTKREKNDALAAIVANKNEVRIALAKETDDQKRDIRERDRSKLLADRVPDLETAFDTSVKQRAELEASTNQTAPAVDLDATNALIDQAKGRRREASDRLRAATEALAIAGQIEAARLEMTIAEATADLYKKLVVAVQNARDDGTRTALAKAMAPFRTAFSLLMGSAEDKSVEVKMSGEGRSTSMTFVIPRLRGPVTIETLSGGEAALAAIALMSALQDVKAAAGRPGKVIISTAQELDRHGISALLAGAPKLGRDFLAVSHNWAGAGSFGSLGAGVPIQTWDVVDMDK